MKTATLAIALVIITAGCSSDGTKTSTTAPVTTTTKAPIHGLVSMGQLSFADTPGAIPDNAMEEPNANPNVYVAAVVNVTWSQLQPTSSATLNTAAIESGLAAIAAYNTAHPTHTMTGKLRIFAGVNAPTWVMSLDGTPFTATLNGTTVTVPRFWTTNYQAAWTTLQNQLAAVYDRDARLQEVAISGCSSQTAEPFITPANSTTIPLFQAAGYTDTQYMSCLQSEGQQYAAWAITPLDYTFNGFTAIDSGKPVVNTAFPIQIMQAWRATYGTARGIVANHGLQTTLTADAAAIYPEFTALGPPIEFQTYGPAVNWPSTIALGLTYNPTEIEIWTTTQAGGQAVITLAQLQQWATEL